MLLSSHHGSNNCARTHLITFYSTCRLTYILPPLIPQFTEEKRHKNTSSTQGEKSVICGDFMAGHGGKSPVYGTNDETSRLLMAPALTLCCPTEELCCICDTNTNSNTKTNVLYSRRRRSFNVQIKDKLKDKGIKTKRHKYTHP